VTERLSLQARARTATIPEATAAIEALYSDNPKLYKLQQYARFRIEGIGRATESYGAEDLLSEAVTRTLEGERNWNKTAVDIVGHLMGVMKSLSSHMAESIAARKVDTYVDSEVTRLNEEGNVASELEQYPSQGPGADRILESQQRLGRIEKACNEDKELAEIFEGMREGFSGPEMQELFSISKTEYETRMKRLRRKAKILDDEGRRAVRA
jgi:hypothetical protein